jgi:RNA polymerase sigma factor (sigma-70 family)
LNTEKQIIKCIKGDSKAQKLLYEKYVGLLFSTVLRYLKNETDAEDIMLQAFLKIFSSLKEFQFINEQAFIAWMKKVAINEALMFKRKEFSMIYKLENIDEIQDLVQVSPEIVNERELIELIEQLPDGYRTVFLLHVVDGYSHKEIGESLKIAEGTSRSQFFKARNLLQKKLGDDYGKAIGT